MVSWLSSEPNFQIQQSLWFYAYKECALSDSDIEDKLVADANISSSLAGSVLRVTFRCESQLLALASPVCVKVGESLGTATLVSVKGCVVALTCAHVLGQIFGKNVSFCEKDIKTNKFKLNASGSLFGHGFSNDDMDIAGVLPVAHLPLLVNELKRLQYRWGLPNGGRTTSRWRIKSTILQRVWLPNAEYHQELQLVR